MRKGTLIGKQLYRLVNALRHAHQVLIVDQLLR